MKKHLLAILILNIFVFSAVLFAFAAEPGTGVSPQEDEAAPIRISPPSLSVSTQESPVDDAALTGDSPVQMREWADQPDTGRDRERAKKMQQRVVMTIAALIFVSILIYIVLKFLSSSKVSLPFLGLGQQSSLIKVVDRHMLQPNKALYLINVAGKHMLIGASENRVSFLSDIDSGFVEEHLEQQKSAAPAKSSPMQSPFDFFSGVKSSAEPQEISKL